MNVEQWQALLDDHALGRYDDYAPPSSYIGNWGYKCGCGLIVKGLGDHRAHVAEVIARVSAERETRDANQLAEARDLLRGHEQLRWPEEAHRLQQQRNAALARAEQAERQVRELREGIEALADEWDSTVYKLPPGYPMTVNEFCRHWFKAPLRAALSGVSGPSEAQVCDCGTWDDRSKAHSPDCAVYGPTTPRHNHDPSVVYPDCPACGTVIPGPTTEGASDE